jgi:hypothetical protein
MIPAISIFIHMANDALINILQKKKVEGSIKGFKLAIV